MIHIAITATAYDAIRSTLPQDASPWRVERGHAGNSSSASRQPSLDRRPGESYSGVILRIAKAGGWGATRAER
jgi:hypothetical protein